MALEKDIDIAIFGATGFTGIYVAEELVKALSREKKSISWAISARSNEKLHVLLKNLKNLQNSLPQENVDFGLWPAIILADVNDDASLDRLTKRSKVLINCVGPFRKFGEQVVRACIKNNTDYVDITGETEFIETMQVKYNQVAEKKGVLVIPSCGFDSMAAEIGAIHNAQRFKPPGSVGAIEAFMELKGGPNGVKVHYGTYESLVLGVANQAHLRKLRQSQGAKTVPRTGPKLVPRNLPYYDKRIKKWAVLWRGCDPAVVRTSQYLKFQRLQERKDIAVTQPFQFVEYGTISNFFWTFMIMMMAMIFSILVRFSFGRYLLLKFPRLFSFGCFSHEGPTREDVEQSSFELTCIGLGYSGTSTGGPYDWKVVTKKVEMGYKSCAIFVTQAALCILANKVHLLYSKGVVTPGAAFENSDLLERFQNAGINFAVVFEGKIQK